MGGRSLTLTTTSYRATWPRFAAITIGGADPLAIVVIQGADGQSPPEISGPTSWAPPSTLSLSRPAGGTWYLDHRGDGMSPWPAEGDGRWLAGQSVPGDYDGDGAGDYAVWRWHDGMWLIRTASSGFTDLLQIPWGRQGDVPVPADYDGDGRSDLALWRPSTGTWHVKTSASDHRTQFAIQWGIASAGDHPAVGDYDGDGRADLAVWRSTTGVWHILRSRLAYSQAHPFTIPFGHGALGDEPIVGDFDEDGMADVTIWRHTPHSAWYVLPSSRGMSREHLTVIRGEPPASSHEPQLSDLDGDGQSDLAVWDGVQPVRPRQGAQPED
jgi:hypothetical protein